MGINLSDWLEAQIDVAAARHGEDSSTRNVVDINQKMLANVIFAVEVLDKRLATIEAKLGLDPFEITTNADGVAVLVTPRPEK